MKILLCILFTILIVIAQENKSIEEMDIEELLNLQVTTATKTPVKLWEVPASLSIIQQQDIQRYGYRNLSEVLASIAEVYMHYQGHNFGVDFRGFYVNNNPRRVLYLINGHKLNDRFHFGDFEPDIIADLTDVDKIEIIRGPGSVIYGNNAVLGVVNIITTKAPKIQKDINYQASITLDNLGNNSIVPKYQFSINNFFEKNYWFSLNMYSFNGTTQYNTHTGNTKRPWNSNGRNQSFVDVVNYNDFYFDPKNAVESGKGIKIPSYNLQIQLGDFNIGSYLHTRATTWVWPKDTWTWNNRDNIRSWGTFTFYVNWNPQDEFKYYDINLKLSYNINTNREVADFSTTQYLRNPDGTYSTTSLFENRITKSRFSALLMDQYGNIYDYNKRFDGFFAKYLTKTYANQHGGGAQFRYAGIDKSFGIEFYMTPYRNNYITYSFGTNYENASYINYQAYTMRDNTFIGWYPGIQDRGFYLGIWNQLILHPNNNLFINIGIRYDYQNVVEVIRHMGGQQMYRKVGNDTVKFAFTDKKANDITPRIGIGYKFTDNFDCKLFYSQAFRAVPPQEIIRLPSNFTGQAESEKTYNYEAIFNYRVLKNLHFQLSAFHLKGNIVYQWNPASSGFSKGSGWQNTGLTTVIFYSFGKEFEAWFTSTYYNLKRATDAYQFMKDYKLPSNPPLPNMYKPLDSPTFLLKTGGSYLLPTQTTLALEFYYNNSIKVLTPVDLNVDDPSPNNVDQPNYKIYSIPSSYYINFNITQKFNFLNLDNLFLSFKINNLLDNKVWNVLNYDMQGYDKNTYYKPNQIPDFGRRFTFQLSYNI